MLHESNNIAWQPTASLHLLRLRAKLYTDIRAFFAAREVMEVETPALSQHTVTDPHIASFQTHTQCGNEQQSYYLQTSPEYAMKRLLAAGSGAIYQIGKAFRNGESGHKHNPEFTMLEWYRPGFDDDTLMQDVDDFLQHCLQTPKAKRITYQQVFMQFLDLDPYRCDLTELKTLAQSLGLSQENNNLTADDLCQFLFSHAIEPKLGFEAPIMVHDFPIEQAALAKIRAGSPPVAERFEVYIKGFELANGFHELTQAAEQEQRFQHNQQQRQQLGYPKIEIDQRFIAALAAGLPACAGVALGIDRLLMLKANVDNIADVIAFPWPIA